MESYYSDLPVLPTTPHGGQQVPPLTPGTNLKVGEALRATYSSWNDKTRQLGILRDPRLWENIEVIAWMDWAASEFQVYSDLRLRHQLHQELPGETAEKIGKVFSHKKVFHLRVEKIYERI